MLKGLLIRYGLLEAKTGFYGIDSEEIALFVDSVRAGKFTQSDRCKYETARPQFLNFENVHSKAMLASGHRGCREIMRAWMYTYDGIAFFIDITSPEALHESRKELDGILSDTAIFQPILVLVRTENASGCANEAGLLSRYDLGDMIKKSNGRVACFAYSLSPTCFIGCFEGVRWLYNQI